MANSIINKLRNDIDKTVHFLRKDHLLRDECTIITRNLDKNCTELTFSHKNDSSKILYDNNISYYEMIDRLLKSQQYYILLYDKSIIQIEFIISKNKIIKAKYLFLKKHNKNWTIDEIKNAESKDLDWFAENSGFPILFRIDFDLNEKKEIIHPACHITFSNHKHCRIALKDVISFSQFINFILFHFYGIHECYEEIKIHQETLSAKEKNIIHFDWN